MNNAEALSLEACFSDVPDARVQGRCDHKRMDILIIAVCAALCGADRWVGVETVARAKETWFRQFLKLENVTRWDVRKNIAQTIRDEKADYILCVKDNPEQAQAGH